MKKTIFKPEGICSKQINVELQDNNIIHKIEFQGGCPGNLEGISRLAPGMDAEDVIKRLEGLSCGTKSSSCPDQLAKALGQAMAL